MTFLVQNCPKIQVFVIFNEQNALKSYKYQYWHDLRAFGSWKNTKNMNFGKILHQKYQNFENIDFFENFWA